MGSFLLKKMILQTRETENAFLILELLLFVIEHDGNKGQCSTPEIKAQGISDDLLFFPSVSVYRN